MSKAILIDVVNKNISYTTINDYKEIYNVIGHGCNTFDCPYQFDNGDTLYVDDEGLFIDPSALLGAFYIDGFPSQPLFGHGLIVGIDDEGETDEVLSTVEEIKKKVTFLNDESAEYELLRLRDIPPTFLSF